MNSLDDLRAAVETVFATLDHGGAPWPSPRSFHDEIPEEAYSRVTEPERYRIVGARADAWAAVLLDAGLAQLEEVETAAWVGDPPAAASVGRHRRIVPTRVGATPIVLVTTGFAGHTDNGLQIGAGEPAVRIGTYPNCGCDACDGGSDWLLEEIDDAVIDVVSGAFMYRWRGDRWLQVGRSSSSANFDTRRRWWRATPPVDRDDWRGRLLRATGGWDEISGASWLG